MPGPPDNWWGRLFLGATAYRENYNKQFMISHGRPPPDTPAGKRLDEANAKKQELLTNPPPVHGNAQWLTCKQARQLSDEVLGNAPTVNGTKAILFLGQYWCPETQQECGFISPRGPGHMLSVATTRAGKGAAQIIPSLLLYGGSMLVIDPKGENYMVTAEHRDKFFGKVFRIDPFGLTKGFDPSPLSWSQIVGQFGSEVKVYSAV